MTMGSGWPFRELRTGMLAGPHRRRPHGVTGRRAEALANRWEREGRIEDAAAVRAILEGKPEDQADVAAPD